MRPSRRPPTALIALNAVLLAALALVTLAPQAGAQPGGGRVPGRYAVVGGEYAGGAGSAVYVLDTANHELIALSWNPSKRALEGIGYRAVGADLARDPGR